MFHKKAVPKILETFSGKTLYGSQDSLAQAISCEFSGIFKNVYFVEHRERMRKINNVLTFSMK